MNLEPSTVSIAQDMNGYQAAFIPSPSFDQSLLDSVPIDMEESNDAQTSEDNAWHFGPEEDIYRLMERGNPGAKESMEDFLNRMEIISSGVTPRIGAISQGVY